MLERAEPSPRSCFCSPHPLVSSIIECSPAGGRRDLNPRQEFPVSVPHIPIAALLHDTAVSVVPAQGLGFSSLLLGEQPLPHPGASWKGASWVQPLLSLGLSVSPPEREGWPCLLGAHGAPFPEAHPVCLAGELQPQQWGFHREDIKRACDEVPCASHCSHRGTPCRKCSADLSSLSQSRAPGDWAPPQDGGVRGAVGAGSAQPGTCVWAVSLHCGGQLLRISVPPLPLCDLRTKSTSGRVVWKGLKCS